MESLRDRSLLVSKAQDPINQIQKQPYGDGRRGPRGPCLAGRVLWTECAPRNAHAEALRVILHAEGACEGRQR